MKFIKKHPYATIFLTIFAFWFAYSISMGAGKSYSFVDIAAAAVCALASSVPLWAALAAYRFFKKREPKSLEVQQEVETEQNRVAQLLDAAREKTSLINTACTPDVFFTEYAALVGILNELQGLEQYVEFYGELPSVTLSKITREEKKETAINDFLDRYMESERSRKRVSVMCKELEPYYSKMPTVCLERLEKERNAESAKEAEYKKNLEEANKKATEELRRKKEEETLKAKIAREKRLRREEEARQEEERRLADDKKRKEEEQKKTAARIEELKSYDEDLLLCEAVEYAADKLHISEASLEDYLPGTPPETIATLLLCLEKLGVISKTSQPGNYLCQVDKQEAVQIVQQNDGMKGYVQSIRHPKPDSAQAMDEMDGKEFEYFCGDILSKNGFEKVFVTQYSGDFGADILAEKDGISYAIQCKCYKETVGNRAVQEAHAGAAYYKKMVAAVMTNSHFTPAAIETAKELQVLLWDREWLLKMVQ